MLGVLAPSRSPEDTRASCFCVSDNKILSSWHPILPVRFRFDWGLKLKALFAAWSFPIKLDGF